MTSFNRVVASGTSDTLSVPFKYLDATHVVVTINGVVQSPSTYSWPTSSQIKFNAGNPTAGFILEARRYTPTEALVTFQPGNLDPQDLNTANLQALFLAEEAHDGVDEANDKIDAVYETVAEAVADAEAARDTAVGAAGTAASSAADALADKLAAAASAAAAAASAASIPAVGEFGGPFLGTASQAAANALLGLGDIHASVKNGQIEAVPSRAWAIANYHPVTTPDYIQTAGYANFGDWGGALYKRVGGEPPHQGKLSITLKDGTTVVWFALAERMVFPEHFGAVADDPGDGTGTDNRAAFQNAIDYTRCVFMRPAATYRIHNGLTIPRFQQLIGLGKRSASEFFVETGQTGATRLVFTGTGTACFSNQDPATMLSHGGMRGFVMRALGTFTYMMNFKQTLDWHMEDIGMQTPSMTMHGINCRKITNTDDSWTNSLKNVSIRLPDGSTGLVLVVDWSDSTVEHCHLTGGLGSFDYGYGVRWLNNQMERSAYAGLTIQKLPWIGAKNSIVVGNSFDLNATHGILLSVDASPTGPARMGVTIQGNNFRTQHYSTGVAGAATIGFSNSSGVSYVMGPIVGNVELNQTVPQTTTAGLWSIPNNTLNMQG